ncbi:hypothetical protein Rhe02_48630 [Rhizocola hellebori]|uniref:histidine kinase n=1 Tax=Rhizocola hellebori TaxID=1392758 RepID=A0A8J3QAA0_9ACTN|nr:hypothetical protein Rhe02_48630 [Rhizocola hellebori]
MAVVQVAAGLISHTVGPLGLLFLLAGPLLLGLTLRKRPALAVTALGALTLIYLSFGYHIGPALPSAVVAVAYAVSHGARLAGWLTLAGVYLGWLALGFTDLRVQGTLWQELRWAGLALLIGGFAELVDNRRQRVAAFRQLYAEERLRREEERGRREEQERLRMARELHDVLAHSLSLIAVRASVALELMESNPEEVRKALVAIKEASKGGLDEVRTVLSGLRDPAPRSPAPSLDRLDELVSETPGLAVTLTRTGINSPLPSAVSLAGYRIVQEALTNVIRHSRSRRAVVHLHQTSHLLLIGVSDFGPAHSRPATSGPATSGPGDAGTAAAAGGSVGGSGLIGIDERAAALGGVVQAGPDPAGGFTVHVALPLTGGVR